MANFTALYKMSMLTVAFQPFDPSKFSSFNSVTTTSTQVKYFEYQGDGFTGVNVYDTYNGQFVYQRNSSNKITDITGTVTSLSNTVSGYDNSGTAYNTGWSIDGVTVDVNDFKTMTSQALLEKILSGDDTIRGSSGNDSLLGFAGNDIMYGNGGTNTLDGGAGDDIMLGGGGNSTYYVDSIYDVVVEYFGGGTDTVYSSVDFTLGQAVDRLTLLVTAINGTGNEMSNIIIGNVANNRLNGADGNDDLRGGEGDDILIGSYGADKLNGGNGIDTADYSTSRIGMTVSLLDPKLNTGDAVGDTFSYIEGLTGSRFADSLAGNNGANILHGGSGNDTLTGNGGDDQLFGDAGNDLLNGGGDGDAFFGGDGTDTVTYANSGFGIIASLANASINTGDAAGDTYNLIENIIGSTHNDYIYGNSGNNVVDGGTGSDFLKGYAGNDTLIGGSGDDVFIFNTALNATTNVDTIQAFSTVDDAIWLDNTVFKAFKDGALPSSAFHKGAAAADASDRIIYDPTTGKVSYDIDGAGGGTATQFALLSKNLALTYADFIVI